MTKFYHHQPQIPSRYAEAMTREAILTRIPFRALLLAAIALCSVVYLWLVNGSAADGFAVTRLEERKDQIDLEYRQLERELAEEQSLDRLQASSGPLGLVPVKQVQYTETSSALVQR